MRPLLKNSCFLSGLLFLVISSSIELNAQVGPRRQIAVTAQATSDKEGKVPWRYLLYLPGGYESPIDKKWPLVFYLHGRSVRGNDLEKIKRYGPPSYVEKYENIPYVVVSPQLPDGAWPAAQLDHLLEEVLATYKKIEPDRVYLTGVSLGAMGAWSFASSYPGRFAALVPICAHGPSSAADVLTGLPIWAFHGAKDKLVPIDPHQKLIEAIKKNGGNARMTVYPDGDHGSVIGPTYEDEEMWAWLLKQKRAKPGVSGKGE